MNEPAGSPDEGARVDTSRALRATCRLQVHAGFTFRDAESVLDYLEGLGVSHVYLSPVLQARPGSTHGYDVADPSTVNPELGSDEEWRALIAALHRRGMGVVLDIVPNHMGIGSSNPYWEDVLAHGQAAHYAHWFDIDWEPPQRALRGRVLVPVLGEELASVVEQEQLKLAWAGDRLRVEYFDHSFPIDPGTAPRILQIAGSLLPVDSEGSRRLRAVISTFERIPIRAELSSERQVRRYRFAEEAWTALASAMEAHPEVQGAVTRAVTEYPHGAEGRQRMLAFLDAQAYRLAYWRRASTEINYRRFFEINELAALRMEDPVVFGERHRLLFSWIADGLIDGLRIDHVDGLFDPRQYLTRLRAEVDERLPSSHPAHFPIFVEKILSPGERVPADWPVDGTTGYEFMNDLESIFIHAEGAKRVEAGYRAVARIRTSTADFHEVAHRGKLAVLRSALRADVARLAALLAPIARRHPQTAELRRAQLVEGVVQMIAALPVYRTYVTADQSRIAQHDRRWISTALEEARRRGAVPDALLELIANQFLRHGESEEDEARAERMRFVMRFQQTSGPATAKGVEDTAIYRYVPLASLNEVGGEPSRPLEDAVGRLHEANDERLRRWSLNLLAVSTHDTKRSADVRARIDVLSEIDDRWLRELGSWRRHARSFRTLVGGRYAPDGSTEYVLYQNLLAIWPALEGARFPDDERVAGLRDRLSEYVLKASREAKAQTSWTDPNEEWEQALSRYVEKLFEGGARSPVLQGITRLVNEAAAPGLWNALARHVVQLTAPGVPDIYQGDDLWDFSLVDPDNRRPVDWQLRRRVAGQLPSPDGEQLAAHRQRLERELLEHIGDGRAKLHVTRVALALRARMPALFRAGSYVPLHASGAAAQHVFAFARQFARTTLVVIVPRLARTLVGGSEAPLGRDLWHDTQLPLPQSLAEFRYLCGGARAPQGEIGGARTLHVGDALASFPVALLLADEA